MAKKKKKSTNVSNGKLALQVMNDEVVTPKLVDESENNLNPDSNIDIDSDPDVDIEPDIDLDDDLDSNSNSPTDVELGVESNDDSISDTPPNDSRDNESQDAREEDKVPSNVEMSNPVSSLKKANFSIEDLVPAQTKLGNRIAGAGALTIVNSVKNGKRMAFATDVYKGLGKPTSAQIGLLTNGIVIGNDLPDDFTTYELKIQGQKAIVYNTDLVKLVTSHFALDFSERTSITFPKADYQVLNGNVIAIIEVK